MGSQRGRLSLFGCATRFVHRLPVEQHKAQKHAASPHAIGGNRCEPRNCNRYTGPPF